MKLKDIQLKDISPLTWAQRSQNKNASPGGRK